MTIKIDFHLLTENDATARLRYVCLLVEKVYALKHNIYIHADDEATLNALNDLLWIFHDTSFLPHEIYQPNATNQQEYQILLGMAATSPPEASDVLINLAVSAPDFYRNFKRVVEVVSNSAVERERARERYKQYKKEGLEIAIHDFKN